MTATTVRSAPTRRSICDPVKFRLEREEFDPVNGSHAVQIRTFTNETVHHITDLSVVGVLVVVDVTFVLHRLSAPKDGLGLLPVDDWALSITTAYNISL